MCIIFLSPQCLSQDLDSQLKLTQSLEAQLDIGLCVDPTSHSAIHCAKLEVRHKGDWYEKCGCCTNLARQWREGKENECAVKDKAEAEKVEKRRSLEMEIMKREEEIVKSYPNAATKENGHYPRWTGRCRALST